VLRDWDLEVNSKRVDRDDAGNFTLITPLKEGEALFEVKVKSPHGLTERCEISIDERKKIGKLPSEQALRAGEKGEYFFSPTLSRISWLASSTRQTELQLGGRFGFRDYRRSDGLAYEFEALGTFFPVSSTQAGNDIYLYRLHGEIGRRLSPPDRPLAVALLMGLQSLSSHSNIPDDFSTKIGVFFGPGFEYRNRKGQRFLGSVYYIPYFSGAKLFGSSNSEFGGSFTFDGLWHKFKPDESFVRMGVRFDYSESTLISNADQSAKLRWFGTSLIYSW